MFLPATVSLGRCCARLSGAALAAAGLRWAHKEDCRAVDCDCEAADRYAADLAAYPTFDALCRVEPLA